MFPDVQRITAAGFTFRKSCAMSYIPGGLGHRKRAWAFVFKPRLPSRDRPMSPIAFASLHSFTSQWPCRSDKSRKANPLNAARAGANLLADGSVPPPSSSTTALVVVDSLPPFIPMASLCRHPQLHCSQAGSSFTNLGRVGLWPMMAAQITRRQTPNNNTFGTMPSRRRGFANTVQIRRAVRHRRAGHLTTRRRKHPHRPGPRPINHRPDGTRYPTLALQWPLGARQPSPARHPPPCLRSLINDLRSRPRIAAGAVLCKGSLTGTPNYAFFRRPPCRFFPLLHWEQVCLELS